MFDQVYLEPGNKRSYVRPEPFYNLPALRPHILLRPNQEHTCVLYSDDPDYDWMVAHEFGHLLGLRDKYKDTWENGRLVSQPEPGWENSIMAVRGKPVDQRLIEEFCKIAKARRAWHVIDK